MRKNIVFAALALAGLATLGFTPTRHDNSYTANGVTYAQRGGLGSADYVVTNVDADAVGRVRSVNGKTGEVTLSASDVGALPSGTTHLSGDVPVTRTVNGKSLTYDITLYGGDIKHSGSVSNTVSDLIDSLDRDKAPKDSPAFSGEPTATNPPEGDRSTRVATTKFVGDAVSNGIFEASSNYAKVYRGSSPAIIADAYITNNVRGNLYGEVWVDSPEKIRFLNDGGTPATLATKEALAAVAPVTNALWTGYTTWRVWRDGVDVTDGVEQPWYNSSYGGWYIDMVDGDIGTEFAQGAEDAVSLIWSSDDDSHQYAAIRKSIGASRVSQLENDAGYISADTNRIVIGRNHETSADTDIICIGGTCKSTATNSTAIGFGAFAVGDYATAIGGSDANGLWNTSVGVNNQTFYGYSSAFGVENYIYGGFSTALGVLNHLYGNYAFSAGLQNTSTNVAFTTVLGYNNSIDSSSHTTIVGRGNKAETSSSGGSTIVGGNNESKGNSSTIVGVGSKTYGLGSTAIGNMAEAFGQDTVAIGQSVVASNTWSVAIGQSAIATNDNAIVIGSSGSFLDRPRSHGKNTINFGHSAVDETKVYIGDRQLADIIDSRAGDIESVVATIPNNITRTASDATLVHCDSGNCTNALIRIQQATSSLAGLMTAQDKIDLSEKAPLNSPAFTGSPTAPTAADGDNSTKLATTAFVQAAIGSLSINPLSGQSFDFATMQGVFDGVKACIEALGGSVTNFPANN